MFYVSWRKSQACFVRCHETCKRTTFKSWLCVDLCVSPGTTAANLTCVACSRWTGCIPDEEAEALEGLAAAAGASAAALACPEPLTAVPAITFTH